MGYSILQWSNLVATQRTLCNALKNPDRYFNGIFTIPLVGFGQLLLLKSPPKLTVSKQTALFTDLLLTFSRCPVLSAKRCGPSERLEQAIFDQVMSTPLFILGCKILYEIKLFWQLSKHFRLPVCLTLSKPSSSYTEKWRRSPFLSNSSSLFFPTLLLRAALHYLNIWNRLPNCGLADTYRIYSITRLTLN